VVNSILLFRGNGRGFVVLILLREPEKGNIRLYYFFLSRIRIYAHTSARFQRKKNKSQQLKFHFYHNCVSSSFPFFKMHNKLLKRQQFVGKNCNSSEYPCGAHISRAAAAPVGRARECVSSHVCTMFKPLRSALMRTQLAHCSVGISHNQLVAYHHNPQSSPRTARHARAQCGGGAGRVTQSSKFTQYTS
jgi:hypothetical protein